MSHQADALVALRARTGLTQDDFAKRVGVSAGLIALIETGRRNISAKFAHKIAVAFPDSEVVEADLKAARLADFEEQGTNDRERAELEARVDDLTAKYDEILRRLTVD